MRTSFATWMFLLVVAACVDRIDIDVGKPKSDAISIAGFISNQPGPYEVRIQNVYDIESKETLRVPVSVKKLELSDNYGNAEIMTEVQPGYYRTKAGGIQGEAGRAYKIRVELYDGRLYESWPDTIKEQGQLDSMYYSFHKEVDIGAVNYYVDVFFNASYHVSFSTNYIWKFRGTFQAETQPELYFQNHIGPAGNYTGNCFYLDELPGCNLQPPCSGLRNTGTIREPRFVQKFPCSCCTCWYNILNEELVLSTDQLATQDKITGKRIQSVILNSWTLMHKIRLSVEQHTLTRNSYLFYTAIQDQKEAIGSLFQPVTGRIPSNFTQLSGPEVPAEGLFYATAISAKVTYITKDDMPFFVTGQLPDIAPTFPDDCKYLYPNSTYVKPTFWID